MQKKQKVMATVLSALMLVGCIAGFNGNSPVSAAKASKTAKDFKGATLVVATWGFTAANVKDLSKGFEKTYNCKVVTDETGGNSDRLNKITAQKKNPEIDVALMTDIFAALGNKNGLFEKIDSKIVKNVKIFMILPKTPMVTAPAIR